MNVSFSLCVVSLAFLVVCLSGSQNPADLQMAYDLYSWPNSHGGWNFSVLPDSDAENNVELVFDKEKILRGTAELKRRISTLPSGAEIHWLDRIPSGTGPKAKGSEGLSYPPPTIIKRVREYARKRGIKVELLGSSPL